MNACNECGSTDIIPDLLVFSDEALIGQHPPYVALVEPTPAKRPFIWSPKIVGSGFRAAVCGRCGLTQFYAKQHAQMLEAQQEGYKSREFATPDILPM